MTKSRAKVRKFWINPNPENRGWSKEKPDEWLCELNPPIETIEATPVLEELKRIKTFVNSIVQTPSTASQNTKANQSLTSLNELIKEIEGE